MSHTIDVTFAPLCYGLEKVEVPKVYRSPRLNNLQLFKWPTSANIQECKRSRMTMSDRNIRFTSWERLLGNIFRGPQLRSQRKQSGIQTWSWSGTGLNVMPTTCWGHRDAAHRLLFRHLFTAQFKAAGFRKGSDVVHSSFMGGASLSWSVVQLYAAGYTH